MRPAARSALALAADGLEIGTDHFLGWRPLFPNTCHCGTSSTIRSGDHMLVFQVDLFRALGALPRDMPDVLGRLKDIQYSSRTRMVTDNFKRARDQDLPSGNDMWIWHPARTACRDAWQRRKKTARPFARLSRSAANGLSAAPPFRRSGEGFLSPDRHVDAANTGTAGKPATRQNSGCTDWLVEPLPGTLEGRSGHDVTVRDEHRRR